MKPEPRCILEEVIALTQRRYFWQKIKSCGIYKEEFEAFMNAT